MTRNEMNRLIAEKCEGRTVAFIPASSWENAEPQWCFLESGSWWPIEDYFEDIYACIRAAKALVAKLPDTSRFESPSFDLTINNAGYCKARIMPVAMSRWSRGEASEPAAALAAALVEAVK